MSLDSTTNQLYIVVATIYYIFIFFLGLFSIFSIYALLRYGRSRTGSFIACIGYSILFLIILQQSYQALQALH